MEHPSHWPNRHSLRWHRPPDWLVAVDLPPIPFIAFPPTLPTNATLNPNNPFHSLPPLAAPSLARAPLSGPAREPRPLAFILYKYSYAAG